MATNTDGQGPQPDLIIPFEGVWQMKRRVDDQRAGTLAHFTGTAELTCTGAIATLAERGIWSDGPAKGLAGERRYLWALDGDSVQVSFDDGRLFHTFDPVSGGTCEPHWCDPDTYLGRYDLALPQEWRVIWQVSGPAKDYLMETTYKR